MTWAITRNRAQATFDEFPSHLRALKDALVTAGWRVLGSGTGASFQNSGQTVGPFDLWAADVDAEQQSNTVGASWIRIATPTDAPFAFEMLWQLRFHGLGAGSLDHWRLEYTLDASGFNSGASEWVRPVSANTVVLAGRYTPNGTTADYRCWTPNVAATVHFAVGDLSERYGFFLWVVRHSNSRVIYGIGVDPLAGVSPGASGPTDPQSFVWIVGSQTDGSSTPANLMHLNAAGSWVRPDNNAIERIEDMVSVSPAAGIYAALGLAETGPPAFAGHWNVAWERAFVQDAFGVNPTIPDGGPNPISGGTGIDVFPMGYSSWSSEVADTDGRFFKGYSSGMIRRAAREPGAPEVELLQDIFGDGSIWINWRGVVLPWGSIDLPDFGAGSGTGTALALVNRAPASPVNATPPVIGNFSPAPGVTISPGRAISFDVTDDAGALGRVIVLVEYPSGAYEVIWDGDRFAAAYVAGSTRSAIANGFNFSVKRLGSWPGSPTIRALAIDTSGNEA